MCNLLAMTFLQNEKYESALELLKKADIFTAQHPRERAVTLNNLACYYRKHGKLRMALQYIQRALKIESKLMEVENGADTYLNACAVLSQLGRHQAALEHAQSALILLQEELFKKLDDSISSRRGTEVQSVPVRLDRIAVLAIAYYNVGVEQEFLKNSDLSLKSFRKGMEIAERYLGPEHNMTITLRQSHGKAEEVINNRLANEYMSPKRNVRFNA